MRSPLDAEVKTTTVNVLIAEFDSETNDPIGALPMLK